MNNKRKKAFTLVEVIIVLAIIAIIAAIAIPNLTKVRQESKIKADDQSKETISRTIEALITDETIDYTSTSTKGGEITFRFNEDSKAISTITTSEGVKVKEESLYVQAEMDSATLKSYFSSIKAPQAEDKVEYITTISSSGEVSTETSISTIIEEGIPEGENGE